MIIIIIIIIIIINIINVIYLFIIIINVIYLFIIIIIIIGFPAKFANLTIKFILTSFTFAKLCRAVKITIQIHSLIIRFIFYVKGICIYVIQFKECLTSIQIRDRTSRRLNWMTRLRK